MSKKSKSKTTTNQTVTATPTNAPWVEPSVQGLQGRINSLLDTDASTLVPGASPLQSQAFGGAAGLLGGARQQPAPQMAAAAPAGEEWVQGPEGPVLMDARSGGSFRDNIGALAGKVDGGFAGTLPAEPEMGLLGGSGEDDLSAPAGGLLGWRGQLGAAQGGAAQLMGRGPEGRSLLDADLDGYMNPYVENVIDTSLAGFDESAGMNRARLAAQQARGQKFTGSGSAIERALFERGSNMDRAGLEAGLRSGGYDRATALASEDVQRAQQADQFGRASQLQATGLLGDLAQAGGANDRADLGLLADLGGQEREIDRQNKGAEANLLALISALNSSQPYGLFRGQTSNQVGTTTTKGKESGLGTALDSIGGLLQGAGSAAGGYAALAALSDKRLKTDIKRVGKDASDRNVYQFRYKGEPKGVRRVGHMAQEVEKSDPHAITKIGGYRAIDYGLLSGV